MHNLYVIFVKFLNIFSQLYDQFMIIRNYAKDTNGLFTQIIGKISALTILQYINYKNNKPISRVKIHDFNSTNGC